MISVVYVSLFFALYVQVFLLVSWFENLDAIKEKNISLKGLESDYPLISILIPCWNEERSIYRTIQSVFSTDYPKNKIEMIVIDDGSTDNSAIEIKRAEGVKLIQKENGGKYSALNIGLEAATGKYIGTLDADSFLHKDAIKNMIIELEENKDIYVLSPIVISTKPKSHTQFAQRAEYYMAIFIKKVLSAIGGLHVSSGAFSVFRREAFDIVGKFKPGHSGEDLEMTFRLHHFKLRVGISRDSIVYTNTPDTVSKLIHQRVRWMYSFINNLIDYRHFLFNRRYGNLGFFTLPSALISLLSFFFIFFLLFSNVYNFASTITNLTWRYSLSDILNINILTIFTTSSLLIISLITYLFVVLSVYLGQYSAEGKVNFSLDVFWYVILYTFTAPFWIIKSIYRTAIRKDMSWR